MLVIANPEPDFSWGCAGGRTGLAFLVTHPRPSIRELTPADTSGTQGNGQLQGFQRNSSQATPSPSPSR